MPQQSHSWESLVCSRSQQAKAVRRQSQQRPTAVVAVTQETYLSARQEHRREGKNQQLVLQAELLVENIAHSKGGSLQKLILQKNTLINYRYVSCSDSRSNNKIKIKVLIHHSDAIILKHTRAQFVQLHKTKREIGNMEINIKT